MEAETGTKGTAGRAGMTRPDGSIVKLSISDRLVIGLFVIGQLIAFAVFMWNQSAKVEVLQSQVNSLQTDIRELRAEVRRIP